MPARDHSLVSLLKLYSAVWDAWSRMSTMVGSPRLRGGGGSGGGGAVESWARGQGESPGSERSAGPREVGAFDDGIRTYSAKCGPRRWRRAQRGATREAAKMAGAGPGRSRSRPHLSVPSSICFSLLSAMTSTLSVPKNLPREGRLGYPGKPSEAQEGAPLPGGVAASSPGYPPGFPLAPPLPFRPPAPLKHIAPPHLTQKTGTTPTADPQSRHRGTRALKGRRPGEGARRWRDRTSRR